ncbi:MAG: polysaccharide deacetylase family protein [Acidobacteria bacterium]|nr:polysaccharide deacetylase family protein [Acidobacteriota bacterium]
MQAISLMYHDVACGGAWPECGWRHSIYTVGEAEFARQACAISSTSGGERIDSISRRRAWQGKPVFLTFDDGAHSVGDCAARRLEQYGWRGHFLITTDWIGRPGFLDAAAIRGLDARGHVIGSHSRSHPERMSHLTDEELLREWSESRQVLEDILGKAVHVASVAGGYYSRRVGRAAAQCGIEVLFTSEPTAAVAEEDGCLILGRYAIRGSTRASVVAAIAAGARVPRYRQSSAWLVKKAAKCITGSWFIDLRRWLLPRLPQS